MISTTGLWIDYEADHTYNIEKRFLNMGTIRF